MNASKEQCLKVVGSYGINTELLSFLETQEQIDFQQGNQFCYNILVSRVQTRIPIAKS